MAAIERGEVRRERMLFPAYAEAWLAERAAKVAYDTLQKNRCHIVCANMHTSLRPGSRKFGLGAPWMRCTRPSETARALQAGLVRNLRARHIRDAPQDVPGCGEGGDADSNPCEYAEPPAIDTEQRTPLREGIRAASIPRSEEAHGVRFGRRSGRA
ncbi:MAG: hypothetical protein ACLUW6_01625 [Coriobacteriaceae bacterium]